MQRKMKVSTIIAFLLLVTGGSFAFSQTNQDRLARMYQEAFEREVNDANRNLDRLEQAINTVEGGGPTPLLVNNARNTVSSAQSAYDRLEHSNRNRPEDDQAINALRTRLANALQAIAEIRSRDVAEEADTSPPRDLGSSPSFNFTTTNQ